MAKPTLKVLDLSHHNEISNWQSIYNYGIRGIIHKASQGSGMIDKTYAGRRTGAVKAGLMWGAYHFGDNSNVEAQVKNFLNAAKPEANTLMALDYEPYGSKTMTLNQARQFLEILDDKLGRINVLYSGNLIKEQLKADKDGFWGKHPLWLAQYGPKPKLPVAWKNVFLWQFSGDGVSPQGYSIPGMGNHIDMNSFEGGDAALAEQWVLNRGPKTYKPPVVAPTIIQTPIIPPPDVEPVDPVAPVQKNWWEIWK